MKLSKTTIIVVFTLLSTLFNSAIVVNAEQLTDLNQELMATTTLNISDDPFDDIQNGGTTMGGGVIVIKPLALTKKNTGTQIETTIPADLFKSEIFEIEDFLHKYLNTLLNNLTRTNDYLQNAENYTPYIGKPRTTNTNDGVLNLFSKTFAIVMPSEIFSSEDTKRWITFDLSVEHNAIESISGTVTRVFIDKSRIASRSYFGLETTAPMPNKIQELDASTNEQIDARDRRIASIIRNHSIRLASSSNN